MDKLRVVQELSNNEILQGKDENGKPYLKYLFELHEELFGTTCSSCPGKIQGYINKIKNYQNPKKMAKEKKQKEQKYIMREGAVISVLGTNKVYSRHNLNDKKALQLLKQNPNRKVLFTKLPENIDDLLPNPEAKEQEGEQQVEENADVEARKAELDEMHYTKLQDIVESYDQEYENKDKAIELIISKEFES